MAKRIHLSVPHQLEVEQARERVQALGDYFTNRYGMTLTWSETLVGRLSGRHLLMQIDGTFRIEGDAVHLDHRDPGLLLRKKALGYLEKKLRTYMNPRTPIEQLPRR